MAGKTEKATHQDMTDFEGPIDTGNPHAKRPADKKQGDMNADTSVSSKDPGTVMPSGKVAEQIEAIFAGVEGLSEGFSSKAAVIVEGILSEQISNLREKLEAEYAQKLEEQTAAVSETFQDKLDSYLSYVVETFMSENQVAIEQGIQNEIAEQVNEAVVQIIEANGVEISPEKVDVAEALAEEVKTLEDRLNRVLGEKFELAEQVEQYEREKVLAEMSADLSDAGKEKLAKLTENLSFESVEDFKERAAILKEGVVGGVKAGVQTLMTESVGKTVSEEPKTSKNPRMSAYLSAARDI